MVERGIRQACLEGNLEALAFPVVIRERIALDADPQHPQGDFDLEHALPFKILKELMVAVT